MAGACVRTKIVFKTKRGRKIEFHGRPGGSTKHGGECAPKPPTAAQKSERRTFASAARKCHNKTRPARNACVRAQLRTGGGRKAYTR